MYNDEFGFTHQITNFISNTCGFIAVGNDEIFFLVGEITPIMLTEVIFFPKDFTFECFRDLEFVSFFCTESRVIIKSSFL